MTDRFIDFSKAKDLNLYWVAIGLLLVALFYNLGVHPLYQEEPRRAIVALEMKINGNYISPTIQGEAYFKKPPVYNWLILVAYHIFGDYSEFAIRFFTVISHILFGLVVYLLCRKHINRTVALYATLVVSVSAHTFFYLSMLSEIDLFYSLISFLSIALIYHFYRLNRYYTLFIVVYLFAGIGTLSKGLPSIIFLGISLPLFFYLQKDFKRLFTLAHVMGMLIFIFIVGGYLYLFSQENDLEELGRTLFSESTDRADAGLSAFFTHLGTFPLTVLKVLLPASLFLPFINYSGLLNKLRENGFVWFCVIMFAANIIIYWISPGSKARYICMLTPFVSIALTYLLLMYPARLGIFRLFVLILSIVICLGVIVLPFLKGMSEIPNIIPNSIILFLASLILVIYSIRKKGFELMALIVLLIIARIEFDAVVLPRRALTGSSFELKSAALEISELSNGKELFFYGDSYLPLTVAFYIEAERKQILHKTKTIDHTVLYLAHEHEIQELDYELVSKFEAKGYVLCLVRFSE